VLPSLLSKTVNTEEANLQARNVGNLFHLNGCHIQQGGSGCSVGIVTRYGDRIQVRASLSAPVKMGPRAYPTSYTMGTGSFPGVKRPGRGFNAAPSNGEFKEREEL
jgi:hypothetical protein